MLALRIGATRPRLSAVASTQFYYFFVSGNENYAEREGYRPLIALAVLAVAALAAAMLTFTNVAYWEVNATLPPAMKYPGADAQITGRADGSGYDRYVYVSHYYDSTTKYNITRISIVGFTGDPTVYTDVVQVCNRAYNDMLQVYLRYVGSIGGQYSEYVQEFWVYPSGYERRGVGFTRGSTTAFDGPYLLGAGECLSLGVRVLVDPTLYRDHPEAVNGKTVIAAYQVNIELRALVAETPYRRAS